MAFDRLDHPFFCTLDPVLDEHPHARIGVGALLEPERPREGAHAYIDCGKSVVVTGASKGIGKGIARVFARNGAKVTIVARHGGISGAIEE